MCGGLTVKQICVWRVAHLGREAVRVWRLVYNFPVCGGLTVKQIRVWRIDCNYVNVGWFAT